MSWIFDTHATPGTNPWSWEWGSPKSFAGHRPCGCRRCESCKCYKLDKSVPRSKQPPPKIAPPPQSAHTAAAAQDWWDAIAQRARSPSPHWSDPEYDMAIKRRAAGADVSANWDPPHRTNDGLALCPMWLQSTSHRDISLSKYYEKYGTFNGAKVIITHKGKDNPAAPAKNSKEAPRPAARDMFDNYILNATVEESNRGVKRSFPW